VERPDGDERDLVWVPANQVGEKLDGRRCDRFVGLEVLGPRELVVDAIRRDRRRLSSDGNGNIRASEPVKELACEPGALRRVSIRDRDPDKFEDRTLQRVPERPPVVDISADVGIEDDLRACLLCSGRQSDDQHTSEHESDSR
jgi:hypothetical protein